VIMLMYAMCRLSTGEAKEHSFSKTHA